MSQRRGRRGSVLGFYWLWSSDWDEVGGLKTRCCSSFSAVISVLAASKGLLSHSSNPHFPFVTRSTCSPVSDYQSDTYSRLDTHLLFISFRFHPFFPSSSHVVARLLAAAKEVLVLAASVCLIVSNTMKDCARMDKEQQL